MMKRLGIVAALLAAGAAALFVLLPQPVVVGSGPDRGALVSAAPIPPASVLLVDVRVPYSQLAQGIEASVPEVFLDETGKELREGVLSDLRGERTGAVTVSVRDERVLFEMPVSLTVKVYGERRANKRADRGGEAPAGAVVVAKLVVEIEYLFDVADDWSMQSTSVLSHRWLEKPTVQLGPLKFGIEKLADKSLEQVWEDTAVKLADRMAEHPGFRDAMQRTWQGMGGARQTQRQPATWWVAQPSALYASSPVAGPDALQLTAGVGGRFQLVVGAEPEPSPLPAFPNRSPLPPETGFRMSVPLTMQWASLSKTAAERVVGQTWSLPVAGTDVGSVTATSLELYPSNDLVVVALGYTASNPAWDTDGTLYMTGRPTLDPDARVVSIEDFQTLVQTWDPAVSNAHALAESGLHDAISEQLTFPFGDRIDAAKRGATANLSRTTQDGGTLQGQLDRLEVQALRVTDTGVVIDALAAGQLTLTTAL